MAATLITALEHLREYWRAYLLNLVFIALLLTTHTLGYADETREGRACLDARVAVSGR